GLVGHPPAWPTRRSSDLGGLSRRLPNRTLATGASTTPPGGRLGPAPNAARRTRSARAGPPPADSRRAGQIRSRRSSRDHWHAARSEEHTSELQSRENLVC